ncbi:UNVERIFIED_CONTAM: hypothetical protein K2H54_019738, partial [Gekko kuhli]
MMNGEEEDSVLAMMETMATTPVTETPVTTIAPITVAPITYAPYLPGQLFPVFYTWSGFSQQEVKSFQGRMLPNPYLSFPMIPPAQVTQWSHFHPESTEETGLSRPVEEQVEIPDDEEEEDDKEDWGPHLAALEKDQRKIQQNLEEVMLTIPEVVIRVIQAEREAERRGAGQRPLPPNRQVPVGPGPGR